VQDLRERVDVFSLAPRREHVRQIPNVAPFPAVRINEYSQMPPTALNRVGVGASIMVNETDIVVHGFVRVTLLIETMIRRPTINYDLRAWFYPSTNNVRQSFSGSIHNEHGKKLYQYHVPLHRISTGPVMSRPQVLHVMLLRINPVSLWKLMAISKSKNRCIKNSLFTVPSTPSAARRKECFVAKGVVIRRSL
jgi:hypothetical protein